VTSGREGDASAKRRASAARNEQALALLTAMADAPPGSEQRKKLRDEMVALHLPLTRYAAGRFANRGVPVDDLAQVAAIGLIKAVDGFDLTRGKQFAAYALPTIIGEIKRYFRDSGWIIHVPRRAKELQSAIADARDRISHDTGRPATVAQLAEHLGTSIDAVVEALDAAHAYAASSLDVAATDEESWVDRSALAGVESGFAAVEYRASLRAALARLPQQQRDVLMLRFFADKRQSDIAALIGVSQMQVSRLISRAIATLRTELPDSLDEL
jgi:RNA polymerase sigma-B factor